MKKFVAVAGNIGVGKSTLVEMLCKKLGWEPFYEPVAENPYLADFYEDMPTWSFHSQVFFLSHRLRSHHDLAQHPTSVMQDRSVYEDAEVFAHPLDGEPELELAGRHRAGTVLHLPAAGRSLRDRLDHLVDIESCLLGERHTLGQTL